MAKIFITNEEAAELVTRQAVEFAMIQNPDYVFPPYEVYPLAARITTPREKLCAVIMDMDGTTTTTEELCLHSLEYMIRQISGRNSKEEWRGLDHIIDYPNVIGNSTTRHVEFLISRYSNFIKAEALKESFFHAALWTMFAGHDENRKKDVRNDIINLGCGALLEDPKFLEYEEKGIPDINIHAASGYFLSKYGKTFSITGYSSTVRAAIDIYYQRYHEILKLISSGKTEKLADTIPQKPGAHLISPMPGAGIFLALIKGWLGEDIKYLYPSLKEELRSGNNQLHYPIIDEDIVCNKLYHLSLKFEESPLKVAIVTSSIQYEADIVMKEVFSVLQEQIDNWKITGEKKKFLKEKFSNYKNVYDTFVTATDSSELRLKPHRDLYSIALHQLGIDKNMFHEVAGFEDSESGTIALRAAGIGLCVAMPFPKTVGHDLSAAAFILKGGLPECLLYHNLFIK